jgi:hypothetical protein
MGAAAKAIGGAGKVAAGGLGGLLGPLVAKATGSQGAGNLIGTGLSGLGPQGVLGAIFGAHHAMNAPDGKGGAFSDLNMPHVGMQAPPPFNPNAPSPFGQPNTSFFQMMQQLMKSRRPGGMVNAGMGRLEGQPPLNPLALMPAFMGTQGKALPSTQGLTPRFDIGVGGGALPGQAGTGTTPSVGTGTGSSYFNPASINERLGTGGSF